MVIKNKLASVYIGIGSNIEPKISHLKIALEKIKTKSKIEKVVLSPIYISEPVGFKSNNSFLNLIVKLKTEISPQELLDCFKEIENEMGREEKTKNYKYKDRIIDIDIILYNEKIIDTKDLIIPHPRFHLRKFVLLPLIKLTGKNYRHPLTKQPLKSFLEIPAVAEQKAKITDFLI